MRYFRRLNWLSSLPVKQPLDRQQKTHVSVRIWLLNEHADNSQGQGVHVVICCLLLPLGGLNLVLEFQISPKMELTKLTRSILRLAIDTDACELGLVGLFGCFPI